MQNNLEYFDVEVAYASSILLTQQKIISLKFYSRVTIKKAIELSGILEQFPEINLLSNKVGVFGKIKKLCDLINHGDRIEIYKDLLLDPNKARILKASKY